MLCLRPSLTDRNDVEHHTGKPTSDPVAIAEDFEGTSLAYLQTWWDIAFVHLESCVECVSHSSLKPHACLPQYLGQLPAPHLQPSAMHAKYLGLG